VQQHQAALPTPYGSTNGSLTRAQSDGFGAAKLSSFVELYSANMYSYSNGLWLLNLDRFKLLLLLIK
jgi:hypothetical protein